MAELFKCPMSYAAFAPEAERLHRALAGKECPDRLTSWFEYGRCFCGPFATTST